MVQLADIPLPQSAMLGSYLTLSKLPFISQLPQIFGISVHAIMNEKTNVEM